ncbi:MAG TPA: efflux RND transporter periplasmic adaptor subunit [Candidatus Krumholzibacteria bacterium]|nr:efflux RND transporter periplasmic adaptor subunit [Candidatus Krumholzibacteria bacterium]
MKKKVWIAIGIVVVLCALVIANLASREKLTKVRVDSVTRGPLTEVVNASGKLEPKSSIDVSATIMGKITRVAVQEGDVVHKGDFLLEIDPEEYRSVVTAQKAALQSAQGDLALAEANKEKAELDLKRAKRLSDQGLSTEDQYESALTAVKVQAAQVSAAQARVDQAKANLSRVRHDLSKVTLDAPISGIVTRLNVEVGENAIIGTMNNPGTLLLTVADLDTMEAEVKVDETEVVRVKLGQMAKVEIDAYPDTLFNAVVTEVGNSPIFSSTGLGQEAVDFKVVLRLLDKIEGVRPGLSATADITVAQRDSCLSIPIASLVERDGKEGVFVLNESKEAQFRAVDVGIAGEERFEVPSGLKEGEVVVKGPFTALRTLKSGEKVEVEKEEKKSEKNSSKKNAESDQDEGEGKDKD